MIVDIHPIEVFGPWDKGFALDKHIIDSVFIGQDPYGHDRFESTRSDIGELVYRLKYKNDYNCLDDIVDTISDFINNYFTEATKIESIIPVPPTKKRRFQPTIEIANELAKKQKVYCIDNALVNLSDVEFKDLPDEEKRQLSGRIQCKKHATRKHSILILDDIFKSGRTLEECTTALRSDSNVNKIYVLAITKTKN